MSIIFYSKFEVLKLRYGWNDDPMTYQAIADIMGFTSERARQTENVALRRIRRIRRSAWGKNV